LVHWRNHGRYRRARHRYSIFIDLDQTAHKIELNGKSSNRTRGRPAKVFAAQTRRSIDSSSNTSRLCRKIACELPILVRRIRLHAGSGALHQCPFRAASSASRLPDAVVETRPEVCVVPLLRFSALVWKFSWSVSKRSRRSQMR
jgi:hypothetical protein